MATGALAGGNVTFPAVPAGNVLSDDGSWVAQGAGPGLPTGLIAPYGGSAAPAGWLLCDGSAVSRTTFSALFAVLGTAYGAGDGSTTFNLPDLRGRVPAGLDAGQAEFDALGETGGAKTHTLTTAEIPAHTHPEVAPTSASGGALRFGVDTNASGAVTDGNATGSTGGGGAHNNLQPYQVVNFIVKT